MVKLTTKMFSGVKQPKVAGKGYAGFDNPRENIDPNIRTLSLTAKELHNIPKQIGCSIVYPLADDFVTLIKFPYPVTIKKLQSVMVGGTQVSFYVYYGSDRTSGTSIKTAAAACLSTTTGTTHETIDNPNVPANNWLWVELYYVGGDPEEFHLTIEYMVD